VGPIEPPSIATRKFKVPKDILDQIAQDIKDGSNAIDAAENADAPPEPEQEPPSPKGE
jgi:hypothetical protein